MNPFSYYKPSLGGSWLLFGLLLVGGIVAAGFAAFWKGVPQSFAYAVTMLPPILFCWWEGRREQAYGESPVALDAPHFGHLPGWAVFALAAIAMLSLSVVAEPATSFLPMPDLIKAAFEEAFVNSALWDMILSACILAPLLEDFLCRGLMLRGMLANGKKPWKAIFWSAFLFAVMHLNPWQSIPAFLIGLLLGWVYWRTRSLWLPIFLHCLNNVTATILSRMRPDLEIDAGLRDLLTPTAWWTVFGIATVLLFLTLYILYEKTLSPEVQAPLDA